MFFQSKFREIAIIFILFSVQITVAEAQCSIPWMDDCIDHVSVCQLADISGIPCTNISYANTSFCNPVCGKPTDNIMWLCFLSNGGQVTIQMTVSNCTVNGTGLEMGLGSNCCSNLACQTTCSGPGVYSMTANLPSCQYLFLFVDGCGGDVCDFTLSISGLGALGPQIPFLEPIKGNQNVCKGACAQKYSIVQGTACRSIQKKWTLDGLTVGGNSKDVILNFPEEGDFELCVTTTMKGGGSMNVCDQVLTECITVQVRKPTALVGPNRYLCPEQVPFYWLNTWIYEEGIYSAEYQVGGCCFYDSVVQFNFLPAPKNDYVYFIGCDTTDFYEDAKTKQKFNTCQLYQEISLAKASSPFRCDSSYFLTAIFLDYRYKLDEICTDSLVLSANLENHTKSCLIDSFKSSVKYHWYLASDSTRKLISADTFLNIKASGNYCVDMIVNSKLENQNNTCVYTLCRNININSYLPPTICPIGSQGGHPFFDPYTIDLNQLPTDAKEHRWRVEGGIIKTAGQGDDSTEVLIEWDPTAKEGVVCYRYRNVCFESEECCETVRLISALDENSVADLILIHPNPFGDEIILQNASVHTIQKIDLLDQLGRKVLSLHRLEILPGQSMVLNAEQCLPGVYFLYGGTDQGTWVKRMVKMK